ncbi:alpha-galactosidase [Sandaracinobacteroides saxicola]|uniref:alpha-galactosidase n=1 Tax=Sandaracinobacteroides saxicola TaxID=2759707 RepID=A0A7G5ILH6_9SPHN|nr:alpha-galactosidase [Sandaracinobacteroides saxicola]QMW24218.1 alpha-galactosidase [Sandaracinobacteroides saxicola]
MVDPRQSPKLLRLRGAGWTLLLDASREGLPRLLHLGPTLPDDPDLAHALAPHATGNQPDAPAGPTIWPAGVQSEGRAPAVIVDGLSGPLDLVSIHAGETMIELTARQASVELVIQLVADGPLLRSRATLRNTGDTPLLLRWLASLALPLPAWAVRRTLFDGRWSAEWQAHDMDVPPGLHEQCARDARPGFGGGQWLLLGDGGERWLGAHLAWSGGHRGLTDAGAERPAMLQLGAWLGDDGTTLAAGAAWTSPEALLALSGDGRATIAQAFHAEARRRVPPRPRPVHFNSWEAAWFDVSAPRAMALAEAAAALGCERFVLDDGWFRGRHDASGGLGDWTPCPVKFPDGLHPLIAHVEALGMDFGLWVEPEMASPGAALLAAHPDWALPTPLHRHQLALDLARADVRAHLFSSLDRLLGENRIRYLKWDHNRPVVAPDPDAHARGARELIARVAAAHPDVMIEGCASGGGRIAFDLIGDMARFWPSDSSDPAVRLAMLRPASLFLPPELLGTHVAASPNPITGGAHAMDFRAKVALFGHMGVEADPAKLADRERDVLRAAIALHKRFRPITGAGKVHWPQHPDPAVLGQMAILPDGGAAVALVARAGRPAAAQAPPTRFPGLLPDGLYRVELPKPWPRASRLLASPERWREGFVLSGSALAGAGLRLPFGSADTAWVVGFQRLPETRR